MHGPPSCPPPLVDLPVMGSEMLAPHLLVPLALLGLLHTTWPWSCCHPLPLARAWVLTLGRSRLGSREPHSILGVGQGSSILGLTLGRDLSSMEDPSPECVPTWRL